MTSKIFFIFQMLTKESLKHYDPALRTMR
jgi:hypothetical protein